MLALVGLRWVIVCCSRVSALWPPMPIDLVCDSKEGLWTVRGATSFLVYDRLVLPVSVAMIQKSTGKVGTTTCADFCEHDSGYLGRPAFQPKMLTHGYAAQTPRIRT